MSTRSFICVEQDDGTIKGVYCHSDGYLTYNGAMLLNYYNSCESAEEILALGSLSTLQPKLYPDAKSGEHSFDFDKRQEGVTVAYGRDRGEKDTNAKTITLEQAKESWGEYLYIFGRDGTWRYYDLCEDEPTLCDVETDLNAEFKKMGIVRPEGQYGYFSQSDIDQIKAEQR